MCVSADQLQAASTGNAADPRRRRRRSGFRVTEDRDRPDAGDRNTPRSDRLAGLPGEAGRRAGQTAVNRTRRTGVALLHQRNHRAVQGRDAVPPQPDGDDRRPPCGLRFAGRGLQPGARRADVARIGPLHPAVRVARSSAGDTGFGQRSSPRNSSICAIAIRAAAPSSPRRWSRGLCRRAGRVRATCARSFTAAARCTSTA